jgi:hypothetical protein
MIVYDEHGKVTPEYIEYERRLDAKVSILVESAITFLTVDNNGTQLDYEVLKGVILSKVATELAAWNLQANNELPPSA